MTDVSYKQFCPVAMASEVLGTRWTLIVVRELVSGSTRFNDLRRGVPRMSPALLSKRLKDLEAAGVIERALLSTGAEAFEYQLTDCGKELHAVIEAVGSWGQRWIGAEFSPENLDVNLLMWDMRRNLNPEPMPRRRSTIQFSYTDLPPAQKKWWLVVEPDGTVDLCSVDPGFDVDLYVSTDLKTMTEVWMGRRPVRATIDRDLVKLVGSRELEDKIPLWLGLSPFAATPRAA